MLRYRVRKSRVRIGPWYATLEEAEEAAIALTLARRDEHYDILHLEAEVVIDCRELDGEDDAGDATG